MKKLKCRWLISAAVIFFMLCILMTAAGCRKQQMIPVFTYEKNDDGTIVITGLTDKGKADSKLTIPAVLDGCSVTAIASEAFRDNYYLSEVVFEEGVTGIAENAFLNCTSLEKIIFPQSLKTVGTHAVTNTKWEKDQLEQSSEIVVNDILIAVKADVTDYVIPENVRTIASGVFYTNTELTRVQFNSGLESIGNYAFSGCTALMKIELPDGLEEIGYGAFSGCTQLDIRVNASVTQIGQDAFLGVKHISYSGSLSGSPWGAEELN